MKDKIIEELSSIMSKYDSCSRLCHDKSAEEIYNKFISTEKSAMCEAETKSLLSEVREENRKLKWMIDNGLGWEDLKNDII